MMTVWCWGWRFREPEVPGAIAPVPATPEMTQEVGIRNCRLYTLPGDATVQEFEERLGAAEDDIDALETRMGSAEGDIGGLTLDVGDLDNRVTTLENSGGGGSGGNAYTLNLAFTSIMANPDNPLYCILSFTYNTNQVPTNAIFDSIDIVVKVSTGTVYRAFTLYKGEGNEWVVTSQEGNQGVSVFTLESASSAGLTAMALRQTSNSLWNTNIAVGDTPVSAKINFHVI